MSAVSESAMGLRQPRANVSWKKKNRKKIDLF